jgi:uncharacterized membrane protein
MADVAAGKLDIGKVISGTFKILGESPASFLIIAALTSLLPAIVAGVLEIVAGKVVGGGLNIVVSVIGVIGSAASLWLAAEIAQGAKPSAIEALNAGLPRAGALLLLTILMTIAIMVGLAFFIVPGVILACTWAVAGAALVVGKAKVFESLKLSAQLTKGARWRILGLLIILALAGGLLIALTVALAFLPGLGSIAAFVEVIVGGLVAAIISPITAAGGVVLYNELRQIKDGVGPENLAKVFD